MKAYDTSFLFHANKIEEKILKYKIRPKKVFAVTKFRSIFLQNMWYLWKYLMDFNKWSTKWKVMIPASYYMQNFWFFFQKILFLAENNFCNNQISQNV